MTGNIARRPNGKWRARYRDESGSETSRHFALKADAKSWLDQINASILTGMYVDPKAGSITFMSFYGQWSVRQLWSPNTLLAMSLAARSAPFSEKPMRAIRRSDVESWIKSMDTGGLASGTIKTRYVNVRSVFRAAVRDRVIGVDPTDTVNLPRRRRSGAAMSIPAPHDVGSLMRVAAEDMRLLIALAAFGGLRVGEAAALQVGDIDLYNKSLKVTRQVQRSTGGTVDIRAPKYGSERVVHLADGLVDLLEKRLAVVGNCDAQQWLFTGKNGPLHQNDIGYRWRRTLLAADLTAVKFHDLRHFYASGLIASGCDVVTVQWALGHARTSTTLNTYAHLWPTAADRTRTAAQTIFEASSEGAAEFDTRAEEKRDWATVGYI